MANKTEVRTIQGTNLRSTDSEDFAIEGVAAAYETDSGVIPGGPNGPFVERISRGAFTRSLAAGADVKALFNHSPNHVLGRLKNKTLRLVDTSAGLAFRVQLDRKNSQHAGIYASVKRGDIDQCSFAFSVPDKGDTWSCDYKKRTLTNVNLLDVSVVCYPAYPTGTSASARSIVVGGSNLHNGIYNVDWRFDVALRLTKLDEEYEARIRRIEGK
jgi:uncharacterized protein